MEGSGKQLGLFVFLRYFYILFNEVKIKRGDVYMTYKEYEDQKIMKDLVKALRVKNALDILKAQHESLVISDELYKEQLVMLDKINNQ